jgi:Fe-S-cluster containining protein
MPERSRKAARAAAERRKKKERTFRDDAGRVHLALHRDPANGRQWVTLKKQVFDEAWQNELTEGAANTTLGVLAHEPSVARVVELTRGIMGSTSQLIAGLLARAPEGSVACKAGCDHCCYQVVGVTPAEAIAIFEHLRSTLSAADLERVTAHLAERFDATRGLTSSERFSPDQPCAFLDVSTGSCTIYEVRPLSCRGMNSLDASECATRLRDPEARAAFLAGAKTGHSYLEPIRAFRAVSAGLQLGLGEIYRLDTRALDLVAAVHLLLQGGPEVAQAWMSGERQAFEAALGGESKDVV